MISGGQAFNSLAWIDDELAQLDQLALRRRQVTRSGAQGPIIRLGDRDLVHFGSNDYLGLAADPRLAAAAALAVQQEGCGAGSSPLLAGRTGSHALLEQRLAELEGTEAAALFSSGYAANIAAITALAGPGCAIYSDRLNHASLIDGCRLSGAEIHVYPHRDMLALRSLLDRSNIYLRRLIVTDTLFSMDGDLAPLPELCDLAHDYQCMMLVDEAHATGVYGANGSGVVEALSVKNRVSARVGTLSKGLGSVGGFVCGSRRLIDWLMNRARPYIFSTAPAPAACAAAAQAIELVELEPERRRTLLERASDFRSALREGGWNLSTSASQIVPLVVGESQRALDMSEALRQRGFYVPAIRPPSVPAGGACLRVSLCASHTPRMISELLQALEAIR